MKEIKAYTTNDGKIFTNETDAINHEKRQVVEEWVHNNLGLRDGVIDYKTCVDILLTRVNSLVESIASCGQKEVE